MITLVAENQTFAHFWTSVHTNSVGFTEAEQMTLEQFIIWHTEANDIQAYESVMDVCGGAICIAENIPYDIDQMQEWGLPDFTKEYSDDNGGMDFCKYLNKERTLAIVCTCTNNSGGRLYIVREDICKLPHFSNHMAMWNAKYTGHPDRLQQVENVFNQDIADIESVKC